MALGLALAVFFLLLVIVAANTLRNGSRQIKVAPHASVAIDAGAVERLAAAIRIETIASDAPQTLSPAFAELHALIAARFPNIHRLLQCETVNGGSLLYIWPGSDQTLAPLLLLAHQDVVPIAEGTEPDWHYAAFSGAVAEGHIWGRGTWDDKGRLFAILEAIEMFAAAGVTPQRTLYLGSGHDEETGGWQGAYHLAALLRSRGVRFECVFDEGLVVTEGIFPGLRQPLAFIGIAEKGSLSVILRTKAPTGHSSMPSSNTAIGRLAQALTRLEKKPMPLALRGAARRMFVSIAPELSMIKRVLFSNVWLFEALLCRLLSREASGRAMLHTTIAITQMNSGNKENVMPAHAEARINIRLLPGDTIEQVLAHLRKAIRDPAVEIEVVAKSWQASNVSNDSSPAFRCMAQAIRETFSGTIVAPALLVGATDSRHFADLADNIYRFSPVRAGPTDLSRYHGSNERLSLANYSEMIRFYRRLLESLCF